MVISNKLSKKIISILHENGIIKHDDIEAYEFCMEYLLDFILYNGSLLILGMLLHKPALTILYILIMTPLKKLTGGFHASTRSLCSMISYGLYFVSIIFCEILSNGIILSASKCRTLFYLIFILLASAILMMSPVPHINKPLSKDDKIRLKKWCLTDLISIGIVFMLLVHFKMIEYIYLIIICLISILISLVLGKLENRRLTNAS